MYDHSTRPFITESQLPLLNGTPGTIMASSGFISATFARSFKGAFLEDAQPITCKSVMDKKIVVIVFKMLFLYNP